jgi:hypothetical protein
MVFAHVGVLASAHVGVLHQHVTVARRNVRAKLLVKNTNNGIQEHQQQDRNTDNGIDN